MESPAVTIRSVHVAEGEEMGYLPKIHRGTQHEALRFQQCSAGGSRPFWTGRDAADHGAYPGAVLEAGFKICGEFSVKRDVRGTKECGW